jgi:hypothetical protein
MKAHQYSSGNIKVITLTVTASSAGSGLIHFLPKLDLARFKILVSLIRERIESEKY